MRGFRFQVPESTPARQHWRRQIKAEGDDADCTHTKGSRFAGQAKETCQHIGKDLKKDHAEHHDKKRIKETIANTVFDALFVTLSVTEGNDWCDRIAQSEGRKEDKLLNLIIQTVCGDDTLINHPEDDIECVGHNRH